MPRPSGPSVHLDDGDDWPATLWSLVHGYATLALSGMAPKLDIAEIMPDFGYAPQPPMPE